MYVGERHSKFAQLTQNQADFDDVKTIFAGKYRRYHGLKWWQKLADVRTVLLNIRDLMFFGIGFLQSLILVARIKPDVILLKGGFVGVPVGFAAALLQKPFVTHDSDVIPGLANRLVGRWAKRHAVAEAVENYPYPKNRTARVGVLIHPDFTPVSEQLQSSYKEQLEIPKNAPVLLVTGGSSGAVRINQAMAKIAKELLETHPDLYIIHQVGKGKADAYGSFSHTHLKVVEFMRPMHVYTGAADLVVTRASANTVAELGVQGKPIIVIASQFLADGHQLKNALLLESQGAAISLKEGKDGVDAHQLKQNITELLENTEKRTQLAHTLQSSIVLGAARKLAMVLLEVSDVQKKN